ncbi:hypothetical protein GCM10010191_00050 [Actinomadura vinacea]|uniref:Uncharacterized protein n=1 Tax=Actinomadura vinacea TaxID=115336 RepID=A0ABN3I9K4_9ACTN
MMTVRRASWCRWPNGTLRARGLLQGSNGDVLPTWAFVVERVTGIEPALSAWETHPRSAITCGVSDLALRVNLPVEYAPMSARPNGHATGTANGFTDRYGSRRCLRADLDRLPVDVLNVSDGFPHIFRILVRGAAQQP